jgi:hypothetical protein
MKRAIPIIGRFASKLLFEIIPGALVSMFAAYFLSTLHLARGAEPTADSPGVVTLQSDGLSADERRELTRQMLKERRENPEEPAEVKPVPSLRPTAPPDTADNGPDVGAPAVAAPPVAALPVPAPVFAAPATVAPAVAPEIAAPQIAAPEAKPRPEPAAKPRPEAARPAVAAVTPATPLPRPPAPRIRTEPAPAVAAPPAAAPAAPTVTAALPPGPGAPVVAPPAAAIPLPPVTVNAPPPADGTEPPRRGFVGNVFSSFSFIAGSAANVTGNTVNWVIDLPGKAISAGGRLLGGKPAPAATPASAPGAAPAQAPAAAPAPAVAPTVDPQRRNYL